jgi:hypothetical protein
LSYKIAAHDNEPPMNQGREEPILALVDHGKAEEASLAATTTFI